MPRGIWGKIVDIAFKGNKGIRAGKPNILQIADPANNIPSNCAKGTMILDSANSKVFVCTVANTTLVDITGS